MEVVRSAHVERKVSLKTYKKTKVKMLQKDFLLKLSEGEIAHLNALENENDVDRYARSLLNKYLH